MKTRKQWIVICDKTEINPLFVNKYCFPCEDRINNKLKNSKTANNENSISVTKSGGDNVEVCPVMSLWALMVRNFLTS